MSARFRRLASSDLMPVGLFVTCALFVAAAVPAARGGSVAMLVIAIAGAAGALGGLIGWVLHADRLAAARERLADPFHLANWWPDFERQFWRYVEDAV